MTSAETPSGRPPAGAPDIPNQPASAPPAACTGEDLKRMVQAGMQWLERHIAAINALNVYPVPDGDTGTNMFLTMQSAWQEVQPIAGEAVGPVAGAVAHGALMGARGNSGVILSQLFRGMAQALEGAIRLDAVTFAQALQQAAQTAYKAVIRPVEGTILTVARRGAETAIALATPEMPLRDLLAHIVRATREAVIETPTQLHVLAEAGVVDAGGEGFHTILEGMLRYLQGETSPVEREREEMIEFAHLEAPEAGYGYDVQFILQGENLDVDAIRAAIDAMGESTLVVGDSRTVKVHVHTLEPGTPLNYGASLGSLSRVIVENMQEQYQEFKAGASAPTPVRPPAPVPPAQAPAAGIAVVAVVPGDGLATIYRSLGAAAIVPGGQTMNPSTEDLLKAIAGLPHPEIILLPNNKNVILTAEQAQQLADRPVRVVPSKTVPQGIGALLAFNPQFDLEANLRLMTSALDDVRTGEVTRAVRSVRINGMQVAEGQIIGLLDGQLVCAGDGLEEVVLALVAGMDPDQLEIVTLYYGEGVGEDEAQAMADAIAERYPDLEIEVLEGGQPHYPYILSGE